ncbi:uncharacterized protein PAC_11572 [Phialocephala subalpina]|uniref:Uncharacterized protein n=1 Tax=Phialocephala subalpina TaxID=576137 RepID=A0A1L7X9H0_9HELO|nr:uncharacterized protein PAC_11572 [Phialocephala subalpina]
MEYEPTDGWPWNINIDGDRLTNINFQTIESAITENEAQQAAPQAFSRNQEQQGFFTPAPLSFWENDDPMQGISMATPQFIDDPDLMRQSEQYLQSINQSPVFADREEIDLRAPGPGLSPLTDPLHGVLAGRKTSQDIQEPGQAPTGLTARAGLA